MMLSTYADAFANDFMELLVDLVPVSDNFVILYKE